MVSKNKKHFIGSMMYLKKVTIVFCIMSIISLTASENNKGLHKQRVKKREIEREFLVYPKDAVIDIDVKNLPKGVEKLFSNMFLVPKGMDAKLIHPTLVPERIPDFEISMTQ